MQYFFILLLALLWPVTSQAEGFTLCEALSRPESYDKEKSYRMLIQGQGSWIFRTSTDFKEDFELRGIHLDRLKSLDRSFKNQGVQLVMVFVPTRGLLHSNLAPQDHPAVQKYNPVAALESYKGFLETLRAQGMIATGITEFPEGVELFYPYDHHWTKDGARLSALAVAEEIRKLPIYADIPKKTFKTEKGKKVIQESSFVFPIRKLCDGNAPPFIEVDQYTTYAEGGALFDDEAKAEIILLGTSNSTLEPSWGNFDGFLKEFLSADVENLAISGAGIDAPLYAWLNSKDYQTRKPKIAILEIPLHVGFKNEPMYRQVIPAFSGDCTEDAVVSKTLDVGEEMVLFENIEALGAKGSQYYIRLAFDEFRGRKFKARMDHANGEHELFAFRRAKRYPHDGLFYLDFSPRIDAPVSKVTLTMPAKAKGKLDVKICKASEAASH